MKKDVPEVEVSTNSHKVIFDVASFEKTIPPTECVGEAWYSRNKNGLWERRGLENYYLDAMNVTPLELRSANRCDDVLRTYNRLHQVPKDSFRPACAWLDHDHDVVLVNCRNSVLVVTADTVTEEESVREDIRFGSQLAAAYDPAATCPAFDQVLGCAFNGDDAGLAVLKWWFGYALWPDLSRRLCLVNYGDTNTGKSTVWNSGLRGVFGSATVKSLTLTDICSPTGFSLPGLQYALLNIGAELDADELAISSRFKLLVGGEPVPVREIYGKPFDMEGYTCKLVFLTNHLPRFKAGTDAELNRLRFLRWKNQVAEVDKDPSLPDRIKSERDGILAKWLIPALQRLLKGWSCPEDSGGLREQFAQQNDPIKEFVTDCCELGRKYEVPKTTLWGAFKVWSDENDVPHSIKDQRVFGKLLKNRFSGKVASRRKATEKEPVQGRRRQERMNLYAGLRLLPGKVEDARNAESDLD